MLCSDSVGHPSWTWLEAEFRCLFHTYTLECFLHQPTTPKSMIQY